MQRRNAFLVGARDAATARGHEQDRHVLERPPLCAASGSNATQGSGEIVDGIDITFWVSGNSANQPEPSGFSFGAGTMLRVGALSDPKNDSDRPVILEIVTPERTVRLHFLNWRTTFGTNSSLFKIPRNCPD